MGIYFYFVNTRTKTMNRKPLFEPNYFGIYWYATLHLSSEEEQLEAFRTVIELNEDWLETDTILAIPDSDYYGIQYDEGVLSHVPYEETRMYNRNDL